MCKELDERKTEPNLNLHFNSFCEKEIKQNKERFINNSYIVLQYNNLTKNGKLLPEDVAKGIVNQFWNDYKEAGHIDFLNRLTTTINTP